MSSISPHPIICSTPMGGFVKNGHSYTYGKTAGYQPGNSGKAEAGGKRPLKDGDYKNWASAFRVGLIPSVAAVKERITAGEFRRKILGARGLVTWCRGEKYYTESGWRGTKEKKKAAGH